MQLDYLDYTEKQKELLAIIGECYLGLDTSDEKYYRNKLNKALKELDKTYNEEDK